MIDDARRIKKNRIKEIDAAELDQDLEAEKNAWNLEEKKYQEEVEDLADDAGKATMDRMARKHCRSKKGHETRIEELMQKMSLERETLDEEVIKLNMEVENLRIMHKKVLAQLNQAKKALKDAEDSNE